MTPLDELEVYKEIPNSLRGYSIYDRFPVSLMKTAQRYYSGEQARTEFIMSKERIEGAVIWYSNSISMEILYHEVGHIKLKCLGVPYFYSSYLAPDYVSSVYVMPDEFYDYLLVDRLFPEYSRNLVQDQTNKLPSADLLRYEVGNMPIITQENRFIGTIQILFILLFDKVCAESSNLNDFSPQYRELVSMLEETQIGGLVEAMRSQLDSLPALPQKDKAFTPEQGSEIGEITRKIFHSTFDKAYDEFEMKPYTIKCGESKWKFW
jgi:hypothetical protein